MCYVLSSTLCKVSGEKKQPKSNWLPYLQTPSMSRSKAQMLCKELVQHPECQEKKQLVLTQTQRVYGLLPWPYLPLLSWSIWEYFPDSGRPTYLRVSISPWHLQPEWPSQETVEVTWDKVRISSTVGQWPYPCQCFSLLLGFLLTKSHYWFTEEGTKSLKRRPESTGCCEKWRVPHYSFSWVSISEGSSCKRNSWYLHLLLIMVSPEKV